MRQPPDTKNGGPQVAEPESRQKTSVAAKRAGSPLDMVRQPVAIRPQGRRGRYPVADASLYEPVPGRGREWLSIRCPYCHGVHLGRLRPGTDAGGGGVLPVAWSGSLSGAGTGPGPGRRLPRERLTSQQLDIAVNALDVLAVDLGRTDADLAEILGVGMAELRVAAGWLYGTRRADRCREYLVADPPRGGRWAA